MEGPYDGEHQPKEIVQIVVNAIKTLSRAPPEYRPLESSRLIKHLTNDVAYPKGNFRETSRWVSKGSPDDCCTRLKAKFSFYVPIVCYRNRHGGVGITCGLEQDRRSPQFSIRF